MLELKETIKGNNNAFIKEVRLSELTWLLALLLVGPRVGLMGLLDWAYDGLGLVGFIWLGWSGLLWLHCGLILHADVGLRPQMMDVGPLVDTVEPLLVQHVFLCYRAAEPGVSLTSRAETHDPNIPRPFGSILSLRCRCGN